LPLIRHSLIALMIAGAATVASAEALVVRSSGPSAKAYPPGKAIPDNSRIILKANDQLVILDNKGTRTLTGPGNFSPAQPSAPVASSGSTFAALVSQRSERRARIGAVRGTPPMTAAEINQPPNVWFVDVNRGATVCAADPSVLSLWRADPAQPASTTLTDATGATATIDWRAGQATAAWPMTVPAASGAYTITGAAGTPAKSMTVVKLDSDPQDINALAAILVQNKCEAQLDLLLQTTSTAPVTKPGG
jgi:hypothetical protein